MFSASDILLHSVMEAPYLPMRFFPVSSIVLLGFLLASVLENIQVLLSFYAFSGMLLLLPLHVLLRRLQRASISPIFVGVFPKGFDSNGVVNIFGNKVAIVLWKEKYPSAFIIENKEIADSFRKWFNLIYKSLE